VRLKPGVCVSWLAGIEGSNTPELYAYTCVVFTVCFVVSGLWDELIARLLDSYWLCESKCDLYNEDVIVQRGWLWWWWWCWRTLTKNERFMCNDPKQMKKEDVIIWFEQTILLFRLKGWYRIPGTLKLFAVLQSEIRSTGPPPQPPVQNYWPIEGDV